MNLVPAIKEMEKKIREIKSEHDKELKEYEDGLCALRNLNTSCEKCYGKGVISYRATAECDVEEHTCPECNGRKTQ